MKSNFVKVAATTLLLGSSILLSACNSSKTITTTYTDGDAYTAAILPCHTVQGSYAWNMMQITSDVVKVTLAGNSYTYYAEDNGVTDKSNAMYFFRTYTWKGALTSANGTYSFAVPTSCTETVAYGSSFAEYKSVWGEQGTFTEKDNAKLLTMFVACTATVSGDAITFAIAA
jgi:hypothetical protein